MDVALVAEAAAVTSRVKLMKDRKPHSTAASIAAATCTLLGTATTAPVQAQEEDTWEFDAALLYYGETDDRVRERVDCSAGVLRG